MPTAHKKVIQAILSCKTPASGLAVYHCDHCQAYKMIFRSCGNRHCPGCQHQKTVEWLERQSQRQLPGPHFLVTFTLPDELRNFVRSHQQELYSAIFAASSDSLKVFLTNSKSARKGDFPGFWGVLHTWGRQLQYHPHIHYVVPGGTLSSNRLEWHPASPNFLFSVKAISKVFKAKFKDALCRAGLFNQLPKRAWDQDWVVHCKPAGDGSAVIKYLAPYVFKVAISNHRILKVEGDKVTFQYRKVGSNRPRTLTLDALEFIRRFLTHV